MESLVGPRVCACSGGVGRAGADPTYGLDGQAVKAMKQWLFKPGTKDSRPVAVRVAVEMKFTLK